MLEDNMEDLSSANIPPMMIIPDMAFETLINGEYSAGVTRHITKYPTKHESIKTVAKFHISM